MYWVGIDQLETGCQLLSGPEEASGWLEDGRCVARGSGSYQRQPQHPLPLHGSINREHISLNNDHRWKGLRGPGLEFFGLRARNTQPASQPAHAPPTTTHPHTERSSGQATGVESGELASIPGSATDSLGHSGQVPSSLRRLKALGQGLALMSLSARQSAGGTGVHGDVPEQALLETAC